MNLPSRSAALLAFFVGLLVAAVGPLPATAQPSQADPETVVLTGGQLFDATDTTLTTNPGVVVRAGKIVAMGEADVDRSGARVVELEAEHVLMPGFIDLHAHYAVDLFGKGRVEETDGYPLLFLANGATTTFTAGELQPEKMQRLRQDVDRGNRRGPRILTSGPYFGAARPGWDTTRTPASVRAEVDRWVERGVRHFKAKRLRGLLLQALIDQAHRHGATVTGHLGSGSGSSVNPREAIDMGIDRIEHFLGGDQLPATAPAYDSLPSASPDEPAFERITRHFIEHSVFFDATISAYGYYGEQDPDVFTDWADEAQYLSPSMRDAVAGREVRDPIQRFETIYRLKLDRIKAFYDLGGGPFITLGTDHPSWGQFLAPFGVHREMHAFAKAGIPEADVLRIATINGARALGMSDRLGTVEVGKWADLVVVRGNPLQDIRNTRTVEWVMVRGRLFRAADLREDAENTVGPSGPEEAAAFKPEE